MVFTTAMLLFGLLYKFISHALQSYRPNPAFILSKYGFADNVHSFLVVAMVVLKTLIVNFPTHLSSMVVVYFAICFGVFLIDLFVQAVTYPYYSKTVNRLRYIESLSIVVMSLFVMLADGIDTPWTRNQMYALIGGVFVFVVLLKMADNLEYRVNSLKLENKQKYSSNRTVLNFVYLGMRYVDSCMKEEKK